MSNIRLTYINLIEDKLTEVEEYVEHISKHKLQKQGEETDLNKNKIHLLYKKTYDMNKHVETYGGILNNNYKDYKNILDKWIQQLDLLHERIIKDLKVNSVPQQASSELFTIANRLATIDNALFGSSEHLPDAISIKWCIEYTSTIINNLCIHQRSYCVVQ